MGLTVNTGNAALDVMLTDFAMLWKEHRGNICICSSETLTQADTLAADGYIVLVKDSDWQYSEEGNAFIDTHTHCFILTCPVSYAELEEAILHLSTGNATNSGEEKIRQEQERGFEITFEPDKNSISVSGNTVVLTPTEFKLLQMLHAQKGEIVPRQALIQSVWKGDITGNRCDVHLAGLRRKLIPVFGKGVLTCIRGAGYVFRG